MTASGYTPSTRTPDHRRGDEREAEHHPEDPDRRPPPPHQRKVYGGEPQPGAHAGPGGQRPRPFHQGEQRHETGVDPPWMPLSEQSGAAAPGPSVHLPRRQPAGGAAAWRQDDRGGIAEQRGREKPGPAPRHRLQADHGEHLVNPARGYAVGLRERQQVAAGRSSLVDGLRLQ